MTNLEERIEEACIEYLRRAGWETMTGRELGSSDPGTSAGARDVVLMADLQAATVRLNLGLPRDAIDAAVAAVVRPESQNLLAENWRVHQLMVDGVPVEYRDPGSGQLVYDRVRLVDWAEPTNNHWLAVRQLSVTHDGQRRRADVVCFLNGLPVAVFELKRAGKVSASLRAAYEQLRGYQATVPALFAPNVLLIASDGVSARIGALQAPWEHFVPWKRQRDGTTFPGPELEVLVADALDHRNFLDLIRNFVVFSDEPSGLVKRVARSHQFWAVREAVVSTITAAQGDGRAGVVWHTQGSGKSLEMLFYAGKILRAPEMENPTVVLLTDRNDLDDQLYGEVFSAARTLPETPVRADSRKDLQALLRRASGGVIFTTIQKFMPARAGERYPELSGRSNVVVVADEAHRSQYGFLDGFALHLRHGLPNATFIAFTATPIESAQADTRQVFGEYVSVYDISDAIQDGATVPIYYEARMPKVRFAVDDAAVFDAEFDEITESDEPFVRDQLMSRWARLETVLGAPDRLQEIATDIVGHWEARRQVLAGKGMIVCASRRICVSLYREIVALRPEWHAEADDAGAIKVVISGSTADDPTLQAHIRNAAHLRGLKARAKDPDDPLQLVIVRDMWLTGFDAPVMHTMYIDKPMRGHGLMQAIARVNRTFRDKPAGLVVDYIGVMEDLRQALEAYSAPARREAGVPLDEAVAQFLDEHEIVRAILAEHGWAAGLSGAHDEFLEALASTVDFVLADPSRQTRFLEHSAQVVRAFAAAVPDPRVLALRDDVGFFQEVRTQLLKLEDSAPGLEISPDRDTAIAQILSRAISGEGVVDIYAAAGLDNPNVSLLSDEFLGRLTSQPHQHLQRELLEGILKQEIEGRAARNVVEYRRFSERLQSTITGYQSRGLTSSDVVAALVDLAGELRDSEARGERLNMTPAELAFYDAIHTNGSAVLQMEDETLREVARELVITVRRNATLDWSRKESVRAKLRAAVRRLLLRHKYPPDRADAATRLVLEQAELLADDIARGSP